MKKLKIHNQSPGGTIRYLVLTFLLLFSQQMEAQSPPAKTSIGSEFKFVFLQNRILSEDNNDLGTAYTQDQTQMVDDQGEISLWVTVANQESSSVDVKFYTNETSGTVYFTPTTGSMMHINPGAIDEYWTLNLSANSTNTIQVTAQDYRDIRNAQMMYNLAPQRKMITVRTETIITEDNVDRTAQLTVYAESRQRRSRDAAMILPTQSLGSEYIAVTANRLYDEDNYPVDQHETDNNYGGPSEIAILAIEDLRVEVTIPPHVQDWEAGIVRDLLASTMDVNNNVSNSRKHTFYLEEGEAIQLQSDFYDLTGTEISARKSNGPLSGEYNNRAQTNELGLCAVFSGNMAAQLGYENGSTEEAFDHVYEQMYPIETWGCEYYAVNTQIDKANYETRDKVDLYKIIAGYDNTIISELEIGDQGSDLMGNETITLNKGEYIVVSKDRISMPDGSDIMYNNTVLFPKDDPTDPTITNPFRYAPSNATPSHNDHYFHVKANTGITVAQFMVSSKNTGDGITGNHLAYQDPAMVLLSPIDQTLHSLDFVTMPSNQLPATTKKDYLIILTSDNHANLELDGVALNNLGLWNTMYSGQNSNWKFYIQDLSNTGNTPVYHNLEFNSSASAPTGFLAYVYGTDDLEAYFYAAGINAAIRRVFPSQTTDCLEPGSSASLDATYLNSQTLLKAEGGSNYTWKLVSAPVGSGLTPSTSIFEFDNVAVPEFKSNIEFTEIGKYVFECIIEKDGSCNLELEVVITVPSCCNERNTSQDYFRPETYINQAESWPDRVFIDDYETIVLGPNADIEINNSDVVFGQCAKIVIESGGQIEANNSVFRACDPSAPWTGISFEGGNNATAINKSAINECTFKNAVNAINIENGESVGIHNNLFLNNHTGIKITGAESAGRSEFSSQIAGNRFLLDNKVFELGFDCTKDDTEEAQIQQYLHYGIKAVDVDILEKLSNNAFNNTVSGTETREFIGYFVDDASISIYQNEFTEMYHGVQANNAELVLYNSEFNVSDIGITKAQVDIRNATIDTDIRSNKFTSWGDGIKERAIYSADCDHASIVENYFQGFGIAILSVNARNTLISQNEIIDAVDYGIYADGVLNEGGDGSLVIMCNTIDMDRNKADRASVGIGLHQAEKSSKISSNCILDCMVAIYVSRTSASAYSGIASPIIENNFMYNYDWAGIYFSNVSNTNVNDKNRIRYNTFYSNSHGYDAVADHWLDIFMEYSFGLSEVNRNINVQNTSLKKFSTASCASQVFRFELPTPTGISDADISLDINKEYFKCDNNYSPLISRFIGQERNFDSETWHVNFISTLDNGDLDGVPGGFTEGEYNTLLTYANDFNQDDKAKMLLAHIGTSALSTESKYSLLIENALTQGDLTLANQHIGEMSTKKVDQRWLNYWTVRLQLAEETIASDAIILSLIELAKTNDRIGSLATSLLNKYQYPERLQYIQVEKPEKFDKTSAQTSNKEEFHLFPNPTTHSISIQYDLDMGADRIEIIDINGSKVYSEQAVTMAGTQSIDVRNFDAGLYLITVVKRDGTSSQQVFNKL